MKTMIIAEFRKLREWTITWRMAAVFAAFVIGVFCLQAFTVNQDGYSLWQKYESFRDFIGENPDADAKTLYTLAEENADTVYQEYISLMENGQQSDLWEESYRWQLIAEEIDQYSDYDDIAEEVSFYLDSSISSLFTGGYQANSLKLQRSQYASLMDSAPRLTILDDDFLELAVSSPIPVLVACFWIFVFSMQVINQERDSGYLAYLRIARYGRGTFWTIKLVIYLLICGIYAFGLLALPILLAGGIGPFDGTAAVQSLSFMRMCPYELTIYQFLFLQLVWKTFAALAFAAAMYLINTVTATLAEAALLGCLLIGLEALIRFTVSPATTLGGLYWCNFFTLADPLAWLESYRTFGLGSYAIPGAGIVPAAIGLILLACSITAVCVYSSIGQGISVKIKALTRLHGLAITLKRRWISLIARIPVPKLGIWTGECWKFLITGKGLVIACLILILSGCVSGTIDTYVNGQEYYFRKYMEVIGGPVCQETDAYIEEETAFWEAEEEKNPDGRNLSGEAGFQNAVLSYEIACSKEEAGMEAWAIYQEPWEFILGDVGRGRICLLIGVLVIGMAFCIAGIGELEYKNNMPMLLNSFRLGKRIKRYQFLLAGGCTAVLSLGCAGMYLYQIFHVYQVYDLTYPAASVLQLNLYVTIPAWLFVTLGVLVLTVALVLWSLVSLILSYRIRKQISTFLVTAGIPLALLAAWYLLG